MGNGKIIQFNKDFKKKEPVKTNNRGFGLFNEGMYFYNQDKNELALKKFEAAEIQGYESAVMFANMAWLYGYYQKHEKVKEYAQKSIDLDKEYGFPYSLLGRYFCAKEDSKKALKYFLEAEKYNCDIPIIYRSISEIYLEQEKNFLKAVEYASKSIELDPKDGYSYHWKGYIYYRSQDFLNALKFYKKAETMVESFASLYYEMSYCYSMLQQHDKGVEYANKYIFLDKTDFWGYYRKGFAYFQAGEDASALDPFLMAEKYGCREIDMYSRVGYLYMMRDNNDEALKWFKKGYKLAGGNIDNEYYQAYAVALYEKNRYKKAMDLLDESLMKFPDDYILLIYKISLLQRVKKYQEAELLTKKIIELEPNDPWTIFYEAMMYSNQPRKIRDYNKVITLLEQLLDVDMDDLGGRQMLLAFAYYDIKDYEKSLYYFVSFFTTPKYIQWMKPNLKSIKKYFKKLYKKFPNDKRLIDIFESCPQVL